ncbi:hypothetical protein BKA82DRAFT_2514346 [Pisolithus tinctorius]|nr:hypothetical protein BKA82DRAFT_2514346 [Pisolithus tinctorius]
MRCRKSGPSTQPGVLLVAFAVCFMEGSSESFTAFYVEMAIWDMLSGIQEKYKLLPGRETGSLKTYSKTVCDGKENRTSIRCYS